MAKQQNQSTPNHDVWLADPCAFIRDFLINPETGQPFELYPAEERFLDELFRRTPDGRLLYPEAVFSAPKKSGKSTLGAMAMLYAVVVLGGRNGEGIVLANDREQATDRIFTAVVKIVEASPKLRKSAKITAGKIEFISSGATIVAIASDAPSAAGSNPTYICADEIWGFTSERAQRLLDEVIPSPARKVSGRLITSIRRILGRVGGIGAALQARPRRHGDCAVALRATGPARVLEHETGRAVADRRVARGNGEATATERVLAHD